MNDKELREFLKEHLSISVECDYDGSVEVHLWLDGEQIASDYGSVVTGSNPYDE